MLDDKELKLDVPSISLDKIEFNDYNPNVVEEKMLDLLRKSIQEKGFVQPITVRKNSENPNHYIIVDGAHRFKIVSDLGYNEIPCVIEDISNAEAKLQTIKMNRFRGQADSLKMAELLVDLKKVYSEEELEGILGFTSEELADYQELLDFDIDALKDEGANIADAVDALGPEALGLINDFIVQLNGEQLDVIETALKQFGGDRSKALNGICKDYLERVAPDKLKQISEKKSPAVSEPITNMPSTEEPILDSPL